jgi:hypothetical protein
MSSFLESLRQRDGLEGEADSRDALARLMERLENQAGPKLQAVAGQGRMSP